MVQPTLKHSGIDHTAFNLQRTPCLTLPRKRSLDGASTECGCEHLIAAHYSYIDPRGWKVELAWLVDLYRTAHPHKRSPVSYRSSAGRRKNAGQRLTFYRWATQANSSRWVSMLQYFCSTKNYRLITPMYESNVQHRVLITQPASLPTRCLPGYTVDISTQHIVSHFYTYPFTSGRLFNYFWYRICWFFCLYCSVVAFAGYSDMFWCNLLHHFTWK